jgi:hypothetical protein
MMREAGAAQSISQAIVGHNSAEVHQLYTHADEDAMRRAVGALPAVLGDVPAPALPPAPTVSAAAVLTLAEGLTAETWEKTRAAMLAMAAKV